MSRVLKSAYLSYAAMKRNCLTAATFGFLYNRGVGEFLRLSNPLKLNDILD